MLFPSLFMRWFILWVFLFSFDTLLKGQSYFPVPPAQDTTQFKKGVARTAWLLSSSSSTNTKAVRILIYGQSISEQSWWRDVRDFVKESFPFADFTFINKAIGGFSSERLKLMAENDVVSFYPDLILFHDYGNEADYEKIIQTIRRKTTAEIVLQTDHMAVQAQDWHDKHSHEWLPSICRTYGLALIDVRKEWKAYLKDNHLGIKDLLSDGVHLNAHGNYLMASIIKQYFASLKNAAPSDRYVSDILVGRAVPFKGTSIEIPVRGNRIDLVWKPKVSDGQVAVSIDGKKPSDFSTCFYYTRPAFDTSGFLKKIGQVLVMTLTGKAREEEWTMSILSTDSVRQQVMFSLKGSITGEDGKGSSETAFTSNSGKIRIDSTHWFRAKEFARFQWIKPGDVLKWKVKCMCMDKVVPAAASETTVVQGIENAHHQLKLSGKGLKDLQTIRVYQPPLQ